MRPARGPGWLPLLTCCLATFLLLVHTSVATVSIPAISADLDLGYRTSQWVVDAYTLALAALLLAMGSLGDRIGARRVFLGGAAAFTLGTLGAGLAAAGGRLVLARAGQGVGGAAMLAAVVPLLARTYTGPARARAFAAWSAVAGGGSTVGTVAGGVVTQYVSWRWLFLGTLPLCLATAGLALLTLPAHPPARTRFDAAGTLAATVAAGTVTYAAVEAGSDGWRTPVLAAVVLTAAVAAFVRIERRAPSPILPTRLFATRAFGAVLACAFGYYFGAFAALPAMSRWLQDGAGMGPTATAFVLTVQLAVLILVALAYSTRLHGAPVAGVLGGGTVLVGLAGVTGALLWLRPDWPVLLVALVLSGAGAGVVSPSFAAVAATSVPPEHAGTAGAAANSARQLGLAIGVALCGAVAHTGSDGAVGAHGVAAALVLCGVVAVLAGAGGAWALRPVDRQPEGCLM